MSDPFAEEWGSLSNLPDDETPTPYNLGEAPGSHLKAIEKEAHDIAQGQLDRVMESIGYQGHVNDVDLEELYTGAFPPIEFLIDPILPRGHVTLWSGHGGSFKSLMCLYLSAVVATGKQFAGLATTQGKVLYYSMEDDRRVVGPRLEGVGNHLQVPKQSIIERLTVRDMSDEPFLVKEDKGSLVEGKEFGRLRADLESGHFDLVVIDNASDAFAANESDRSLVRRFIAKLKLSATKGNCAVILISHVNKQAASGSASAESYSGSTAWHNSSRSRVYMSRDEDRGTVMLKHEKSNLGPLLPEPLEAQYTEAGGFTFDLRNIEKKQKEATDARLGKAKEAVLRAINEVLDLGETVPAGSTSLHRTLGATEGYPQQYTKVVGKRLIDKAIQSLKKEKLLETTDSWINGNKKQAITFTDAGKSAALSLISPNAADEVPF